jgi:hypothetical protein
MTWDIEIFKEIRELDHFRANTENEKKCESGNAVLEFITFIALLVLPLVTFFSLSTVNSANHSRHEELFREVTQIIRNGEVFSNSVETARRYVSLHDSDGELQIICLRGNCPQRGSEMKISWRGGKTHVETFLRGGSWQ